MRVFLGLDLPMRDVILYHALENHLKEILRLNKMTAYFKEEGQFHITLQFLGDVPESQVEKIDFLEELAKNFGKTEFTTDSIGAFPTLGKASKLFLGVRKDPKLYELLVEVNQKLKAKGLVVDEREFVPHITIANFEIPYDISEVLKKVRPVLVFPNFQTANINLYRSTPGSSGSNYQVLKSAPLQGA